MIIILLNINPNINLMTISVMCSQPRQPDSNYRNQAMIGWTCLEKKILFN